MAPSICSPWDSHEMKAGSSRRSLSAHVVHICAALAARCTATPGTAAFKASPVCLFFPYDFLLHFCRHREDTDRDYLTVLYKISDILFGKFRENMHRNKKA